MGFRLPLAAVVLVLAAPHAAAQTKAKLDGATFGPHISGPKVEPADLKGRVVVVEFWGIN
jgi:hypothetical protein